MSGRPGCGARSVLLGTAVGLVLLVVAAVVYNIVYQALPKEMQAAGRLRLVAEFDFAPQEGEWDRLGTVLAGENVAKLPPGFYTGPRDIVGWEPEKGPKTPEVPRPPPGFEAPRSYDPIWGQSVVAGGNIAAAVYCGSDDKACHLLVSYRTHDKVRTFKSTLFDRLNLFYSWLCICRGGQGLLIYVTGYLDLDSDAG